MGELNDIPKRWKIKLFEETCDIISLNGIKIKQKDYLEEGKFPVVDQGQGIIGGYFNDEKYLVPTGPPYIIFGDHTKVKKFINFRFIAGADGVKVLKPHSIYDTKFFFYLLHIIKIPDKGYARHFQFLVKKEIPLPPLPEQQAIVSKIEELFSDLENGRQQLLTAQQQLKVYRQSLLKAAFEGKLTTSALRQAQGPETVVEPVETTGSGPGLQVVELVETTGEDTKLPKGWKCEKLGSVLDKIEAGKSFKCIERVPELSEVGVLKVSAVTWNVFDEMESKTVFDESRINEDYFVKKDDFLFSRANTLDLIGAVVLVTAVERKLMLSDKTLRFRFNPEVNRSYILYYLKSRKGRSEIQRLSTGNQESMRNIGQERIKQIQFPLCTLKEQQLIVSELESKLTVCDKIEETISQSLQQAETLKQSILKKAFEGKLV